jgi:hypothetical protein
VSIWIRIFAGRAKSQPIELGEISQANPGKVPPEQTRRASIQKAKELFAQCAYEESLKEIHEWERRKPTAPDGARGWDGYTIGEKNRLKHVCYYMRQPPFRTYNGEGSQEPEHVVDELLQKVLPILPFVDDGDPALFAEESQYGLSQIVTYQTEGALKQALLERLRPLQHGEDYVCFYLATQPCYECAEIKAYISRRAEVNHRWIFVWKTQDSFLTAQANTLDVWYAVRHSYDNDCAALERKRKNAQ